MSLTISRPARSTTFVVLRSEPQFGYTIDTCDDRRLVAELVDDADFVFHLAAAVGVQLIVDSPVRTIETNVHCTEVVLAAADKKKKPVFIASTSEVYGKSRDLPFREDGDIVMGATTRGRWSYACSKALDEFLAIAYYRERGLPTVVGRLFNTVGPRQTGRYGMVVPTFVRQALAGEPITVFGVGGSAPLLLPRRGRDPCVVRADGAGRSAWRGVQHRLDRGGLDDRAGRAGQEGGWIEVRDRQSPIRRGLWRRLRGHGASCTRHRARSAPHSVGVRRRLGPDPRRRDRARARACGNPLRRGALTPARSRRPSRCDLTAPRAPAASGAAAADRRRRGSGRCGSRTRVSSSLSERRE